MQDDIRASLDDLAIRWETPKGRELKERVIQDARNNRGNGIAGILEGFMYVSEVPHGKDLRCITLDGQDLSNCQFGKVDLSWASLAETQLTSADLSNSNLKRANLSNANLSLARLDGIDGSRADFSKSNLDGTHLKEAKLTGSVFVEADVRRASFDSANMAKANFRKANVDQANFFNADCNNANFDSGALDRMAERPAKAWGIRWDLDRDVFEKEVGLKAITSRATKKFKGLDILLKASAQAEALTKGEGPGVGKASPDSGMVFGASLRGTKKHAPVEDEPEFKARIGPEAGQAIPDAEPGAPAAHGGDRPPSRRPPPPPGRRPDTRTGVPRPPRPGTRTGVPRPTRRGGPPPTGRREPPPVGGRRNTGRGAPPPTTGRPGGPPPTQRRRHAPPPPPKLPIAPFEEGGPEPSTEWAQAIGQLMQMKDGVTKIVIELGDKSRIVFKKPGG